jgi:hypothetical protein
MGDLDLSHELIGQFLECVISGFRRVVNEICFLLGFSAA